MTLYDLIPRALLDDALEQGHVRKQTHPELPLAILNYTERAAYDSIWNEATLTCRGLIYDERDRRVVARPFPKFFNYGQPGAPELDLDAPAAVTEKMDGSLGILYPLRVRTEGLFVDQIEGFAIATRGSFASDQAIHATEVLLAKYGEFAPDVYSSYLFEIVYPENRIVCDYGDLDDLILLDVLDVATGKPYGEEDQPPKYRWPGPRVEIHPYRSLAEALAAEPRPGKEGLVVYLPAGDVRVKIKQADYVALHRIVTGLNKRTVWEHLGVGRRDFAELATKSLWAWALFLRLDGKDYGPKLWHLNRPDPETPAGRVYTEDVA